MIEPQSVHAGESAVSKTTGACPALSRSSLDDAAAFCATIFNPSSSDDPDFSATASGAASSPTDAEPEAAEYIGAT
jgi:hypothetical protein